MNTDQITELESMPVRFVLSEGFSSNENEATLDAWGTRYPTKWIFCPDRKWAEKRTYLLLERFWRDVRDGKRPAVVMEGAV